MHTHDRDKANMAYVKILSKQRVYGYSLVPPIWVGHFTDKEPKALRD